MGAFDVYVMLRFDGSLIINFCGSGKWHLYMYNALNLYLYVHSETEDETQMLLYYLVIRSGFILPRLS